MTKSREISITCLNCGNVFKVKMRNNNLRHYSKNNQITRDYNGEKIKCKCGSEELIFSSYA